MCVQLKKCCIYWKRVLNIRDIIIVNLECGHRNQHFMVTQFCVSRYSKHVYDNGNIFDNKDFAITQHQCKKKKVTSIAVKMN